MMEQLNWRPHRFMQSQFLPSDVIEILWPTGTIGMIDTINLTLTSEDSADIALVVNTSVIASAQLLTAGGGPEFEVPVVLTNLAIPIWEGDLIRLSFGLSGDSSAGSIGVYGRVGGWLGPIVPLPGGP